MATRIVAGTDPGPTAAGGPPDETRCASATKAGPQCRARASADGRCARHALAATDLVPTNSAEIGEPSAGSDAIHLPLPTIDVDPLADNRRRHIGLIGILVVLLLGVASLAVAVGGRGPSRKAIYLAALGTAGVREQFATEQVAVANATRVCADLKAGKPAEGFVRDRIGVESYCDEFLPRFKVLPTPEEQQATYLGALRTAGLAGKFSSDQTAVAHAKAVCAALAGGSKQQGMPEDRIGVEVYCGEFLNGYKVLRTITVKGSITLLDSDPGIYYPTIVASGGACEVANGYGDVHPGTQVQVRNGDGKLLGQTTLERGRGTRYRCTLDFQIELTEGESTYQFETGRRGAISFSFAELMTGGPQLSLGD